MRYLKELEKKKVATAKYLNNILQPESNEFLKYTNKQGIMTRPVWQLMYKLPMYEDCHRDEQKNAEYLEDRIVNIPSIVRIDG